MLPSPRVLRPPTHYSSLSTSSAASAALPAARYHSAHHSSLPALPSIPPSLPPIPSSSSSSSSFVHPNASHHHHTSSSSSNTLVEYSIRIAEQKRRRAEMEMQLREEEEESAQMNGNGETPGENHHENHVAAASSSVSPVSPSSSSDDSSTLFHQALHYIRSIRHVRSSLLSGYALWRWAMEQLPSGMKVSLKRSQSQSTVLSAVSRGGNSNVTRALRVPTTMASLRHTIRILMHIYFIHARHFHRFLRPHLLLLVRSRALSQLLRGAGMKNAIAIGHVAMAWGSIWILLKRSIGLHPNEAASITFLTTLRDLLSSMRTSFTQTRLLTKLLALCILLALGFLAQTCVAILREHAARKERARARIIGLSPKAIEKAVEIEIQQEMDRGIVSPSPFEGDMTRSPSENALANSLDLGLIEDDRLIPHHRSSFSFHRDCIACVAEAVAITHTPEEIFNHNHPPSGHALNSADALALTFTPHVLAKSTPEEFVSPDPSITAVASSSSSFTQPQHYRTPSQSIASHAAALSARMNWSPQHVNTNVLPLPSFPLSSASTSASPLVSTATVASALLSVSSRPVSIPGTPRRRDSESTSAVERLTQIRMAATTIQQQLPQQMSEEEMK